MSAHGKCIGIGNLGIGNHEPWLLAVLGRLLGAHRRRRAEAEMISTLADLQDRSLADIGVARDQIPAIARRLVQRYG